MKLSQIRDILAIAEAGSLRKAGRQLGVNQASITRSIQELEHELGVSLFERHAKGVTPTEIGRGFVRRAITVQTELRRAREEIDFAKGLPMGEVRVAMSSGAGLALLPRVTAAFRKRFPKVLIRLTESLFQAVEADILSGAVDFYIGPLDRKLSATRYHVDKLFGYRRFVFSRRDHPLAKATSLSDLTGVSWIRPTFSGRYTEADFTGMFARVGLPPPMIVMHCNSAMLAILTVMTSDLFSIVPEQFFEFPALRDYIVAYDFSEELHASPVCLVRRSDLPLTPMAQYFANLVQQRAMAKR